ncbi:10 kDa chaperonin (Protein Cpn10) (groES protein) [Candidatus Glomeribacter gigasporarum BEG34]|uniref:Co-chaperonin GroES n=1 Tax=Candidatus Glomeribacter gigasporarum BEG34 TaxID=1070319 RepID=G2J7U2_9BURK|nr:co-chaperone GroES [Candidatus Glomeribacter gigasporarum]CCD28837.1 10 kDa chaperonin (Protein Cpn10) (groES protein) [Candidatus Glomeribacter gigasporarum BEG34]
MKKLRPLHDRVIVKRLDNETKSPSGLVIPETAAEKPVQGKVMAIGPGRKDKKGETIPMDVNVDDVVLFGQYAGQTVKVDGEELLVMREEDIMAVIVS